MDSINAIYLRLVKKHVWTNSDGTHDTTGQLFRRALNDKNIDKLLSYEKLLDEYVPTYRLPFANTVMEYLHRNKYKGIASFLTGEHLHALNTIEDEIPKHSSFREFQSFDPRHDALRNLVVDNFEYKDEIVYIIQSNRTIDPVMIHGLMEDRLGHHPSIRNGTL